MNPHIINIHLSGYKEKGNRRMNIRKKTLLQDSAFNNHELTEDEKQREVDKFFAQESARRANWRRTHKK